MRACYANPRAHPRKLPAHMWTRQLLEPEPERRLGYMEGAKEVKGHMFFQGVDWEALLERRVQPPYVPQLVCVCVGPLFSSFHGD